MISAITYGFVPAIFFFIGIKIFLSYYAQYKKYVLVFGSLLLTTGCILFISFPSSLESFDKLGYLAKAILPFSLGMALIMGGIP